MLIQTFFMVAVLMINSTAMGEEHYQRALKRSQYLLGGKVPTDAEIDDHGRGRDSYRAKVRDLILADEFYKSLMRYHERDYGTGLDTEYIDELKNNEIDDKQSKFARITCARADNGQGRLRCYWTSEDTQNTAGCPVAEEEAANIFWYPGIVAWACPSVTRACGHDLSRCFINYTDEDEAQHSELGTTEVFDSRFSVIKSLSKQSARIASRLAAENYPYSLTLKSGLSAVDGAVVHFYRQNHHFKIDDLKVPNMVFDLISDLSFRDSKYVLVHTGDSYESAGIISTFGWLRRYEKHRTRANQLYERVLCRKFTSELPRVFPQDPGNLRTTDGCSGCHATLDPLSDFFNTWGEGGELYNAHGGQTDTYFAGKTGRSMQDLSNIVRNDLAFATCTVQNVWEWLMGRKFYHDEDRLRAALANYFVDTRYSFRELVYAIATHPGYMEGFRGDGIVTDPLEEPPLGQVPNDVERPCVGTKTYSNDIAPSISMCTNCHNSSSSPRSDLSSESGWTQWGSQAVQLMASAQMPPGVFGPTVTDFKENVRCWLEQQ